MAPESPVDLSALAAAVPDLNILPIAELLILVLTFIGTLVVTLAVGAALVSVASKEVRAVSTSVQAAPLRSGLHGVATAIAGVALFLLLGVTAAGLAQLGAPQQIGLLVLLPAIAGGIGLIVATALGAITVGASLLSVASEEPNLWLALIVGATLVGLLSIIPVINYAVFVVPTVGLGGVVTSRELDEAVKERLEPLLEA